MFKVFCIRIKLKNHSLYLKIFKKKFFFFIFFFTIKKRVKPRFVVEMKSALNANQMGATHIRVRIQLGYFAKSLVSNHRQDVNANHIIIECDPMHHVHD